MGRPCPCSDPATAIRAEIVMEEYQKLKRLIEEVADDIDKAVGGNKAAGTRVRRVMQDIKNAAQDVRKRILEMRGSDESPASPPPQP